MKLSLIIHTIILLLLSFSQAQSLDYVPPQNLHLALTGDPTQMIVQWMTSRKYSKLDVSQVMC